MVQLTSVSGTEQGNWSHWTQWGIGLKNYWTGISATNSHWDKLNTKHAKWQHVDAGGVDVADHSVLHASGTIYTQWTR